VNIRLYLGNCMVYALKVNPTLVAPGGTFSGETFPHIKPHISLHVPMLRYPSLSPF